MPSTVIDKISYDVASSTLRIIFLSGNIYDYENVPLEIYQAMKQARSKGIFFNEKIKGSYSYKRIG